MMIRVRCAQHDVALVPWDGPPTFEVAANPDTWELDLSNMGCPTSSADGAEDECSEHWEVTVLPLFPGVAHVSA